MAKCQLISAATNTDIQILCYVFLDNCFIDEGYSGVFNQLVVSSPINIGGHGKTQSSQVGNTKF